MRVLLTGATGFIGSALAPFLAARGHELRSVSRGPAGDYDWSDTSLSAGVEWCEAVVHLAGANIFDGRWNSAYKELLLKSRVEPTRKLAELCVRYAPRTLVCASGVGYYGPSEVLGLTEDSPPGEDFLARLCVDWEAAQEPAQAAGLRCATMRMGVVLSSGGGALQKMLLPFRLGLGGRLGSGRQWFPWIHLGDTLGLYTHVLEHDELSGVFNVAAPAPVTNAELTRTLARVLRRPAFLPVPSFALRLVLGEASDVLLTGQHVLPEHALASGYEFEYGELGVALRATLG